MTLPQQLNNQQLSDKHCFLCGNDTQEMSDEHVVPKWLQHKYDLWDKRLTLLNGTNIPYRLLKVPCCVPCNNQALSNLEDTISNAVKGGYTSASALDKELWFYWAAKLVYGLWRKEFSLAFNQRDSSQGTILSEEQLKSFGDLHLFLQGINGKHRFVGEEVPYSVLVCNLHDLGEEQDYFYKDNLAYQTISIRMGEVGVIVCFSDDGVSEDTYGKFLDVVNGRKLHPLQFDELYAHVNYQISLMDKKLSYVTALDATTGMKETTVTSSSYFRERNPADLCEVLKLELSRWLSSEDLIQFVPPESVTTFLFEGDGKTPYIKTKSEWEGEESADSAL